MKKYESRKYKKKNNDFSYDYENNIRYINRNKIRHVDINIPINEYMSLYDKNGVNVHEDIYNPINVLYDECEKKDCVIQGLENSGRMPRCCTGFNNKIPGYFDTNYAKIVYKAQMLFNIHDTNMYKYFDDSVLDLEAIKEYEDDFYLRKGIYKNIL